MVGNLKWASTKADRKPDFDLEGVKTGDRVTLQIGKNESFSGRWLYTYSNIPVSDTGSVDFTELALPKGAWFARARINGGVWLNTVPFTIA